MATPIPPMNVNLSASSKSGDLSQYTGGNVYDFGEKPNYFNAAVLVAVAIFAYYKWGRK